ncbi:hypothetical protein QUF64_07175 [Anaerolineales bacterium HSG6]|nr:hypothetical protein [Anaerolineales bacterium HSG6]MDM8532437.1 hypothetical protein [Anaerolineales bacterium HSG25]
MSTEQIIQQKMARLQTLRQYQSYYGPHTPYPVILEINQLEKELGHLLRNNQTHFAGEPSPEVRKHSVWHVSRGTIDILAMVSFIGLLFALGVILLVAFLTTMQDQTAVASVATSFSVGAPVLRPTFTPTHDPNAPLPEYVESNDEVISEGVKPVDSFLPTPAQATDIPTPVPTITPRASDTPTIEPTFAPTNTPTRLPPTPIPVRIEQPATPTPSVPTPTPAPSYPFRFSEQGNREFQRTTYHAINIYIAVVSEGNIPLGGYKIVGDHVPSGLHAESALSTWNWSVTNCLDCDYVKQGNVKFEPGPIIDGTWNIYLADEGGRQVSPVLPLNYSSNPEQWVWDFVIFRRING